MNNQYYLDSFSKNVEEFVNSKFLLVETRLSKFLSSIAKNKLLYSLIESCLQNFNFEQKFKEVTADDKFTLPSKAEDLIAIVFCILVEADNKKLNFYKFLTQYFNAREVDESFRKFNESVIIPFKNCVIVLCTENTEPKEPEPKEPTFYEIFVPVANSIIKLARESKKCENAEIIVYAMAEATKTDNIKLFNALKVSLYNSTKNRKFVKAVKEMLTRFE